MAGIDDLIARAKPAVVGGGVSTSVTEGREWRWRFIDVNDNAGDPIDLTAVTGECTVWDGTDQVTTLTFTGGVGEFTVSKAKADTVNLAGSGKVRRCAWGLEIADGDIQMWVPGNSTFLIYNEDGALR